MSAELDPLVGAWYESLDKGQRFEVVAVDEPNGVVEIQYFDGDLDEIDLETWYDLELELVEAPEDWTGPVDDVEEDDLGYSDTEMAEEDWDAGYQQLRRPDRRPTRFGDEEPEEEMWGEGKTADEEE